jgi:hypothetical protein
VLVQRRRAAPFARTRDVASSAWRAPRTYRIAREVWSAMKWTGSADGDADIHEGMETTISRIKAAAEA